MTAVEIIRLTLEDCRLLATRFDEYDNSHLRLEEALAAGIRPETERQTDTQSSTPRAEQDIPPADAADSPLADREAPSDGGVPDDATPDDVACRTDSRVTDTPAPEQDQGLTPDAANALARLRALRRLECHFSIDLGALYHRFQHRDAPGLHPLERSILDSIARWHHDAEGRAELWVLVDNVRQVRELIDEERAEWLEPAGNS